MGKHKSSSKSTKKSANETSDKMDNGKASNKKTDGKAKVSKNKEDNPADAKTVKGGKTVQSKASSSGHNSLWLLLGLSVVVGMAAIIYINEDVQMFFVKLTPLGSNPWQSVLQSAESSQTIQQEQPEVVTTKHKAKYTQESVEQVKDIKRGLESVAKETEQAAKTKTPEAQTSNNQNAQTENVGKKSSEQGDSKEDDDNVKETKQAGSVKDDTVKEAEKAGKKDDTDVKQKKKSAREDYPKSKITNKADFKIRKKLDAAEALFEEGDISRAAGKFDAILKDHPQSPRALWGKGRVLDKMAEQQRSNALLEEGMGALDRAMRLEGTPDALVEEIGRKLAERQGFRGWMGKEAATWRYLASRFPDRAEFENLQGVAYLKAGKIDAARAVFQQVLARYQDNGFALVHLGFILKTSDLNYKEAIPMLQRGIDSQEPGVADARFYTHLGDAYHRMNQTEKAKEIYMKGYELGLFLSQYQRSSYNAETSITGRPWWTVEQTTYSQHLQLLEKNWKVIREEGLAQMNKKTGSFKPEDENLSDTGEWKQFTLYHRGLAQLNKKTNSFKPEDENLSDTGEWKQFTLYHRGQRDDAQCKKAPKTCALIDKFPASRSCTRGQVKFSLMHPGVHVWPHTGPTNCRLRAHLGLIIPEGPKIRVADEIRTWKEGKFIIFDDSFEHEVWHDGTELRLVLIVDFWHPEIPEWERQSLSPI